MVAKDPESKYVGGRTLRWLKVKVPEYRVEERGFYKPWARSTRRSLMVRALFLSAGLVVTLTPPACWATDVADYRTLPEASQIAYVAGVVDRIMFRGITDMIAKNQNVKMSDLKQSPFVGCIMRTSYGTFLSVTRDLLATESPKDDDSASLAVARAVAKLCPQ
jgi:hypothetical protein